MFQTELLGGVQRKRYSPQKVAMCQNTEVFLLHDTRYPPFGTLHLIFCTCDNLVIFYSYENIFFLENRYKLVESCNCHVTASETPRFSEYSAKMFLL